MNVLRLALQKRETWQLFTAVTITEAVAHWMIGEMTIRRAIDDGRLTARKSGRTWLIACESLERNWGPPIRRLK